MDIKFEERYFNNNIGVWIGTYYDLNNIAHWHKQAEIIFVRSGEAQININNHHYDCAEGDLIICPGGNIHYINNKKESILDILIFEEERYQKILSKFNSAYPTINSDTLNNKYINTQKFFKQMRKELHYKQDFFEDVITSSLTTFLSYCYRCAINTDTSVKKKGVITKYQKLFDYIDKNFATITYETAVNMMYYTPSHFSKTFKEITGMNFTDYMNLVRVEKAVKMIKTTDKNISEIAGNCGFDSVRNFNRIFKKLTHITPHEVKSDFHFITNPTKAKKSANDPTVSYKKFM